MAASWHMGNLQRYLQGNPSIFDDGIEPLRSLTAAHHLWVFHYTEASERLKLLGPFGDSPMDDFVRVLEVRDEDIEATVALAAYVYASVSLTRDAYDYMAQLLNAVASVSRVSPHKVDANTVFPLVRPGRIRKLLDDARASDAYAYVLAFSNVTKHQRALPFSFSISLESGASHFGPPAFTKLGKKNVSHDALKTSHILAHCKELWIRLDEIGRAINDDRGVSNRLGI